MLRCVFVFLAALASGRAGHDRSAVDPPSEKKTYVIPLRRQRL
jgi:hypothetical protein